MRFSTLVVLTVAVFGSSPMLAWAGDTQNTPASDPNRVVCKPGKAPIGSRIPGPSICLTQKDWDAMAAVSKQTTEKLQERGLTTAAPGSGG